MTLEITVILRRMTHGAMGRRIDSSLAEPLSYFSFQAVFHDWCNKRSWYIVSCLWDGAYKRPLAANRKE